MTRAAYAFLGVGILGIAAGFVVRELTSNDQSVESALMPKTSTTSGAPAAGRTGSAKKLPDLRFIDGAGSPRSLSDFRGRVILLNLWATWCVPCRDEMPALDRLQAALGGPDFEVVALSLDRDGIVNVKRFYEELKLRALQIYVDQDGDALGKLGSVGIPLTVLVDRKGRELWRVVGPREWDQPAEVNRIRGHLAQAPKP
jgi:thiol-disulfide isomerase/thioredoxin